MEISAENIRFHAAGHIAAAYSLAASGHVESARHILKIVREYLDSPRVESPQSVKDVMDAAILDPLGRVKDLIALEELFCDQFNTTIEKSNGGFGSPPRLVQ